MKSWRRRVGLGVALFAMCFAAIAVRAVVDGKSALERGQSAATRGDDLAAVEHFRRATRWYVPLASHVDDGYAGLRDIASRAEAAGNTELALSGWRAIRRSAIATRWLVSPHEDELAEANQHIAALMAKLEPEGSPRTAEWHQAKLAEDHQPRTAWVLVSALGLFLWLGGGVYFARRGITESDRLSPRHAARGGVLVVLGLVVWLVGLAAA